jgi:sugar phosphate isomerase/epimerase
MDCRQRRPYGYPQDWIRTLGKRISRLHLKDFRVDRESGKFEWKNIGEGDIDWQAVRAALGRRAIRHVVHDRAGRRRSRVPGGRAGASRSLPRRVQASLRVIWRRPARRP